MRVLIFHPALAPYRVDFFNELGKRCDLRVVFMTHNNYNQRFDQSELLKDATYSLGYLPSHYRLSGRDINVGYEKEIVMYNPDVVICSEYGLSLWASYVCKLKRKCKYKIFTICDDSEDVFENRKGLRKFISRYFAKRIDGIICVNPNVQCKYLNIGSKQVLYFPIIQKELYYQTKLREAIPKTNSYIDKYNLKGFKCILYVGRLTAVKNIKTLIKSFSSLINCEKSLVKLIIVGDGDQKAELENFTNTLGLTDNVILTGRFEGLDLYAWYNLNAVFALLSTYEPFGAVVGEALMAGMCAVVSDKVGAKCLINSNNGEITNENDTNEIIHKIKKQLDKVAPIDYVTDIKESILNENFDNHMDNLLKIIKIN